MADPSGRVSVARSELLMTGPATTLAVPVITLIKRVAVTSGSGCK